MIREFDDWYRQEVVSRPELKIVVDHHKEFSKIKPRLPQLTSEMAELLTTIYGAYEVDTDPIIRDHVENLRADSKELYDLSAHILKAPIRLATIKRVLKLIEGEFGSGSKKSNPGPDSTPFSLTLAVLADDIFDLRKKGITNEYLYSLLCKVPTNKFKTLNAFEQALKRAIH